MASNFKVGFIGLGIMGESMCANLLKGGHETWAYDIDPEKVKQLEPLGARGCSSVAEVAANASHIFIMVPNNQHVTDVIDKLLAGGLQPGSTVVDMSTISPVVSKELARRVKEAGSAMLDAPVVRSKQAAIDGTLGIYVGGDAGAFKTILPLLQRMGENITHLGPNGNGLAMKLCHNTLVAQIQNGVNEMVVLANKFGLDVEQFATCMSHGGGQNFYLDAKAASISACDFSPKFPLEHMHKDLGLTIEAASSVGLTLPGVGLAMDVYKAGMAEGLQREDFSASIKIVEKKAKE